MIIINIVIIIVIIIVITIIKDTIGIASFFSSLLSVEYKSSSSNERWQRNADHDESSYLSVLLNWLWLSVSKALNTLKLFNRRSYGLHSRRGFDTLRGKDDSQKMMKERDYHKKHTIKCGSDNHWILYQSVRNKVNSLMRKGKSDCFRQKIDASKATDPKAGWELINSLTGKGNKSSPVNDILVKCFWR